MSAVGAPQDDHARRRLEHGFVDVLTGQPYDLPDLTRLDMPATVTPDRVQVDVTPLLEPLLRVTAVAIDYAAQMAGIDVESLAIELHTRLIRLDDSEADES